MLLPQVWEQVQTASSLHACAVFVVRLPLVQQPSLGYWALLVLPVVYVYHGACCPSIGTQLHLAFPCMEDVGTAHDIPVQNVAVSMLT